MPLVTDGLVLQLETKSGVQTLGSVVQVWRDQTVNRNDLFALNSPQLVASGLPSSLPSIYCDATSELDRDHIQDEITNMPSGDDDRSIFILVKFLSSGSSGGFIYGNASPNQAYGVAMSGSTGKLVLGAQGAADTLVSDEDGVGAGWMILESNTNNGVSKLLKDGVEIASHTHTYNTVITRITIGGGISGGTSCEMEIACAFAYDKALSATERQNVIDYINNTYLITPNFVPSDDAVTFDGENRLIRVNDNVTFLDVKEDLYSAWKRWAKESDNLKYPAAFRSVGGDPLPGEKSLGSTYFLNLPWRIKPFEGNHTLTINGNLYEEDGSSPVTTTNGSYNVQVIQQVSSLVDSTVQQLEEIEYASYQNKVWLQPGSPYSGTTYPVGTPREPVSNLADAKAIADERGFKGLINVNGTLVLAPGDDISNFKLEGTNPTVSVVGAQPGSDTQKTEFENIYCTGYFGDSTFDDCYVEDIYLLKGYVLKSFLGENIYILPGAISYFNSCISQHPTPRCSTFHLDDGAIAIIASAEGRICLSNQSLTPCGTQITLNNGTVLINPNAFIGQVVVDGLGTVIDATTGEYLKTGIYNGTLQLTNNTLSSDNITNRIFEDDLTTHTTPNTFGWLTKQYLTLKQFLSLG